MSVYLDHNATTPLDAEVREAMQASLGPAFGNPSSVHARGRAARDAIEQARVEVAALAGAEPGQVVFTGGGTEANNLALKGLAARMPGGRILIGATEHEAIRAPAEALARRGWAVAQLPVDAAGRVDPATVAAQMADDVRLVSVMWANNETGVINDIAAIARIVRDAGAVLHTDAVQAAGKLEIDFRAAGVQLMTLSAHKLYGPKGVGALIMDRALDLEPLVHGGGQEQGRRGGTEGVAGIVGFGHAAALARARRARDSARQQSLRERLEAGLAAREGVTLFGRDAARLPNTVQCAVAGLDGEALVLELDQRGFAVSSGSACHSRSGQPSHVLLAMGVEAVLARCAIRISLGRENTAADVDGFLAALDDIRQRAWPAAGVSW